MSSALADVRGVLGDRYDVAEVAGVGGMATVYRATRLADGLDVAIKVLDPRLHQALGPDRFLREIAILSKLHHPGILPLLDSGVRGDCLYFVMPFVASTVRERLRAEPQLAIEEALRISRAVLEALQYAHKSNVLHRDIKPENILLDDDRVLVADFGIARAIIRSGGDTLSSTGFAIGTPGYMSPEQAQGQSRLDGRTDLYSVGCLLYELLIGTPPFTGPTIQVIQARHLHDPPPPLRSVRPAVNAALEGTIHRALAKVPGDRFPTAGDFIDALDASVTARAAPPLRGRRGLWVGASGLVLAAATAAAFFAPVNRVDPDRYVVLPFRERTGGGAAPVSGDNATRLVWQGLSQWRDLKLIDEAVVEDRLSRGGETPVTLSEGAGIARQLGAGLVVWGEIARDGNRLQIRASVFRAGRLMQQAVQRAEVSISLAMDDSTGARLLAGAAELARRLVLPAMADAAAPGGLVATTYYGALRAALAGDSALARWNLDLARQRYQEASSIDPGYAAPRLRYAEAALWSEAPVGEWRPAAEAALSARLQLSVVEQAEAEALVALGRGDFPRACDGYRAIIARDSLQFAGWFGLGDCLTQDSIVVPDARSPSGWRFRGNYQAGIRGYLRALAAVPLAHVAFGGAALTRLSRRLLAESNEGRIGVEGGPAGRRFAAYPELQGDSLVFTPYPIAEVMAGRHPQATGQRALRANREALLTLTSGWLANYPDSPVAVRAHAWSLELAGTEAALPLVRRLRSGALGAGHEIELAAWEVRLLLKARHFTAAATLAESTLARRSAVPSDAVIEAGLAALLGKANLAADLAALSSERVYRLPTGSFVEVERPVAAAAQRLLTFAGVGAPADSIVAAAEEVRRAVGRTVEPSQRSAVEDAVLYRARVLGFPLIGAPTRPAISIDRIEAAMMARNFGAARREFDSLTAGRRHQPASAVVPDHVVLEARLLAQLGDSAAARSRLRSLLDDLSTLGTDLFEEISQAGAVPRALMLELMLDPHPAQGSDTALAALWRRADEGVIAMVPMATTFKRRK